MKRPLPKTHACRVCRKPRTVYCPLDLCLKCQSTQCPEAYQFYNFLHETTWPATSPRWVKAANPQVREEE